MGLLDELESEAQRRKSNDEDASVLKAARETAYRTVLEPAMADLLAYLKELAAKLTELQPKIAIRHSLAGYGDVVAYVEHEFDVREVRQPSSKEITVAFHAAVSSSECPSVQIEGGARVRAVSASFQRHRLGAPLAASKDASGEVVAATFKAKGRIPLTAVFSADAASGQLRLSFSNFDDFATAVKTVAPDQVNEELYDKIGRYLMREPTDLMREVLPENYRSQLRARVHHEEVKRRWESQIVSRQQEDIALLKREYGIGARFNRIGDAMGKLRGLVSRK
ncbi:MAG TPA: hypothetical protein VFN25_10695 [Dokdonella sp.]|uniref:hypothetical protein n=1 Tax=Dokdonella sp. TaxID=2291710 RepID=UPI002D7FB153|nr:hypothetical protein [Dokdonella sp.]HET9033360.1 hypothetical protein [Dokdonella sp.]